MSLACRGGQGACAALLVKDLLQSPSPGTADPSSSMKGGSSTVWTHLPVSVY